MTEPIPDDVSPRRRTWLIAGVLSLVVVLIGIGVSFAVLATRSPATKPPAFTPAEETSSSASGLAGGGVSPNASASVTPTSSSVNSASTTTTPAGQIVRSGKIAYRLTGQIWVSGEDGSGAKAVLTNGAGRFSLSPDGLTLAVMQGNAVTDHALLVDVASGAQAQVPLSVDLPTWAPDSSWLAYTAGGAAVGYTIRRVNRDGSHDGPVVSGAAQPQISGDGKRLAYTKSLQPEPSDALRVVDLTAGAKPVTVPNAQGATRFSWAVGGSLYFARTTTATAGWLGVAERTLTKSSVIASLPAGTDVSPSALFLSPDGSKVFFAMAGDDGYSHLYICDVAGKKIVSLTTYRDAYPVGWLLNGSGLLYIDGNVIQKETPSLNRMNLDGSHKKVVVAGAGL
jgi:Tol biopolymer transport system component